MILQHNIPAQNAHRFNVTNGNRAAKNLEKLSSGFRINRAGDDASGLAISEKMRAQVRGMSQASDNTENAADLIQTAEGALQEMHNVLQRMGEVAVQASNGTYHNAVDREALDMEFQELKGEFDRIVDYANYNGIPLLDGSLGAISAAYFSGNGMFPAGSMGAIAQYFMDLGFPLEYNAPDMEGAISLVAYSPEFVGKTANFFVQAEDVTGSDEVRIVIQIGDKTYTSAFVSGSDITNYPIADGSSWNANNTKNSYVFLDDDGRVMAQFICLQGSSGPSVGNAIQSKSSGVIQKVALESGFTPLETHLFTTSDANAPMPSPYALEKSYFATQDSGIIIQIGANGTEDQQIILSLRCMNSAFLGLLSGTELNKNGTVADAHVRSRDDANDAIEVVRAAVDQVSLVRSYLGAVHNRLDHALNNLSVTIENVTASESTIRDVDMAKEMMEFTKNSILTQASQAMLAQANELPQGVLTLLR